MSLQISDIILILAAAQGLFLTTIIFVKFSKLYAVRFVGLLTFLYSITLIGMIINDMEYSIEIPYLFYLFMTMPFTIGPLHYLFSCHLIQPNRRFHKRDWLHFIPGLIVLIIIIIFQFVNKISLIISKSTNINNTLPTELLIFNWTILLHASIYFILTFIVLTRYAKKIKEIYSSIEKIQVKWLFHISYFALIVMIIYAIENIFMNIGINLSNYFTITSIGLAIYIYSLGYMVLIRSEIFTDPQINKSLSEMTSDEKQFEKFLNRPKYEKSGLSPERARHCLKKLVNFMESEKPYRDNNLTLKQLSEMTKISSHHISEVLNTQLGENFYDFVNKYRVREVKQALKDPRQKTFTILSIAFDAGFNSKTAFNTIFKKFTHTTPSQYRNSLKFR